MRSIRSRVVALATVLLMLAGGFVAASSSLAGGSKRAAVGANPPSPVGGNAPAPPVVPAAPANAVVGTAQRSFVSAGSGSDSNPCTRSAPCRNFQAAIAQTVSGGEVVALDSGGYGPVTINQAITLVAPPGVYAGVTAFSGPAIGINAG